MGNPKENFIKATSRFSPANWVNSNQTHAAPATTGRRGGSVHATRRAVRSRASRDAPRTCGETNLGLGRPRQHDVPRRPTRDFFVSRPERRRKRRAGRLLSRARRPRCAVPPPRGVARAHPSPRPDGRADRSPSYLPSATVFRSARRVFLLEAIEMDIDGLAVLLATTHAWLREQGTTRIPRRIGRGRFGRPTSRQREERESSRGGIACASCAPSRPSC